MLIAMQPIASPMQSSLTSTGTGQSVAGGGQREKFAADELAIVLSHFEIGVIDNIVEFARGSRKAPKVLVASDQGKFLLKRRARGKDDAFKVAFSHALQLFLVAKQFPLPHLIGTRYGNNSMLEWRGGIYELFEYIPGQSYPYTLEATFDSGRILGLYHKLLVDFQSEWQPSSGSYHQQASVHQGLGVVPNAIPNADPGVKAMVQALGDAYDQAADCVEREGMSSWPKQYVHGDWHPGNMLYRDNHVVAVIDYDSARQLPRIIDIANGALQFSIIAGDDDVAKWPDYVDESRFKRFMRGYDQAMLLSEAEIRTLPWLMVEALIAEAVLPIALTGQFGRMEGLKFLQMIQRKAQWLAQHADKLKALLEG
jgi:homoserine kinase type II